MKEKSLNRKRIALGVASAIVLGVTVLAGCTSDADVARENLSKDAEQFKILRRIVFVNGITDKYLLSVEGYCSVETGEAGLSGSLEVTCKTTGDGGVEVFKKHFLGLSDNTTFFVEQLTAANVSTDHYKVIFKPEVIIPDVDRG